MKARRHRRRKSPDHPGPARRRPVGVRIIGGRLRGRRLVYQGDLCIRPMKDRLREALFNRLGDIKGMHAVDLFAGTGALGIEAISRGAARATLVERHRPAAAALRRNVADLGLVSEVRVVAADVFAWIGRGPDLGGEPWLVFCSPPYDFYVERLREMLELLDRLIAAAPAGSRVVVESDERFDFARLPHPQSWDVRREKPALLGIFVKEPAMDVQNVDRVPAFTTKDGSEIRELLAHRNSSIRNQTLAEARVGAGQSTTTHHHVKTEEIYYILAGRGLMRVGEETREVGPGDAVAIPPGSVHQITGLGPETLKFLCCCAPGYEHEDTILD